jgi:hypothetical protein
MRGEFLATDETRTNTDRDGKACKIINCPTPRKWGEFIVVRRIDTLLDFFVVDLVLGVCVSKTIFPHLPPFLVVQRITLFVENWENGRMNTQNTKAEGGKRESGNEGDQSRAEWWSARRPASRMSLFEDEDENEDEEDSPIP